MAFESDTLSTATTGVFVGSVFSDTFSVGFADVDMIRITLTAGQFYEVDVDNGTAGDFYLRIFDDRGHEVKSNDDGNYSSDDVVFSLSPYTRFTPGYTGDYYFAISPYYLRDYDPATTAGRDSGENPLAETSGTLRISDIGPSMWGSAGSINAITFESGNDLTEMLRTEGRGLRVEFAGTIDTSTDVDMVRVDLRKAERVVVDVNGVLPGGTTGTVLRVFDDNGVQIGFDDDSGAGEDSELIFNVPIFDDYYIGISGEGNSAYSGLDGTGTVAGAVGAFQVIVHINPTLVGSAIANVLNGGVGDDYIVTLAGNDTVAAGAGQDTLAGGDDNDSLSGDDGEDDLFGEHGADSLFGGAGADHLAGGIGDDLLNGGIGADTMVGETGNDFYFVDNAGDLISEIVGQGSDRVLTSVSYTLTAAAGEIELFTTTNNTGTSAINLTGNAFANIIVGNSGANILNGGAGADTLNGLLGNDTYVLGDSTDTVVDTGGTADRIVTTISRSLASYTTIENLTLSNGAINGTGNGLANIITGNTVANTLNGGSGNDTLLGLAGNDILIGGLGKDRMIGGLNNDIFNFGHRTSSSANHALADVITDFDKPGQGDDRIDVSLLFGPAMTYRHNAAFTAAGQLRINDIAGADVIVEVNVGGSLAADFSVRLAGATLASMNAGDFVL